MPEKTFKQVCKCENCGNEAEMQVTCSLELEQPAAPHVEVEKKAAQVLGHAVCSQCGNEADLWVTSE